MKIFAGARERSVWKARGYPFPSAIDVHVVPSSLWICNPNIVLLMRDNVQVKWQFRVNTHFLPSEASRRAANSG